MNKRIKELVTPKLKEWAGDSDDNFSEELEKFAELIIRECMNLVTYVGHSTRGFDCCGHVRFTNEKIKEHFGIE
jgi:hypothetical protein